MNFTFHENKYYFPRYVSILLIEETFFVVKHFRKRFVIVLKTTLS